VTFWVVRKMLPALSETRTETVYVPSGAGKVTGRELLYACHGVHVVPSVETCTRYTPARSSAKASCSVNAGLFVSAVFDGAPLIVKLPVGATVSTVSVGVDRPTGDPLPALSYCTAVTV
jgi:hypothetical protein